MWRQNEKNVKRFVEGRMLDSNGVVYSLIDKSTLAPATDEFFAGSNGSGGFSIPGFTQAEFASYENCGMTTGAYMRSLLVNPSQENIGIARRCFGAIRHIFKLGENLEFGFFPKIYGGRFSPQTSTDQVLYAVTALDAFYNFATAGERQEIRTMLPAMVNFWIKRGYKYTYYLEKDMLWPLDRFPALMLLAMQYSAEPVFKSEYERLLPLTVEASCSRLKKKLSGETPPGKYEIQQHAWVLNQVADAFTMQTMQNLLLLRFDPENPLSETWKADIARLWKEAKLTIAPDGKNYFRVLVDMDSGEARQMPADSPFPGGGSRMGWTPMIVRAALEGIDYLPDRENVLTLCLKVLNQLDVMDLTYFDDPACFPEEMRYKTRFLSGDAMTNYLWSCELIKRMEGGM